MERDLELTAYETSGPTPPMLVKSPVQRPWMDQTPEQFAHRCLPLTIANQMGWVVLNPHTFTVWWNGGARLEDLVIQFPADPPEAESTIKLAASHFGSGIVTFSIPYLVRTAPNYNLWVKGPANNPKDGISPLEGIVETDWSPATFTMNWKMTRRHQLIQFDVGEPIAVLVPYPRRLVERFDPLIRPLADNPELESVYQQWSDSRESFNAALKQPESNAVRRQWQKDYSQGRAPDGSQFEGHQTHLDHAQFRRAQFRRMDED